MRITFVIPYLELNGGNLVVAIYANGLAAKGHHVTLVAQAYPKPTIRDSLRSIAQHLRLPRKPEFITNWSLNIDVRQVTAAEIASGTALPEADVLIATWWETMEWIALVGTEKGQKIHFVQGHEIFDYLPQDRTKATLLMPVPKLVVSEWLFTIMHQEYHAKEVHLIENAVDVDRFHSPPRDKNVVPTFGFLNSRSPVKNTALAIKALNAIKKEIPSVKAISFGAEIHSPLNWIEYHCRPPQELIPKLYARCDAWLYTSTSEGFGLPILEAMASRTPVIATPTGVAPQLISDKNGQMVDFSVASVVAAMRRISDMADGDWSALSDNAYKQASRHTWQDAIDKMEKVLRTCIN